MIHLRSTEAVSCSISKVLPWAKPNTWGVAISPVSRGIWTVEGISRHLKLTSFLPWGNVQTSAKVRVAQYEDSSIPARCEAIFHPSDTKQWNGSREKKHKGKTRVNEGKKQQVNWKQKYKQRQGDWGKLCLSCLLLPDRAKWCLKNDESGTTGKDRSNKAQLCDLRHRWESRAERGKAEKTVRFLWALPCCVCSS